MRYFQIGVGQIVCQGADCAGDKAEARVLAVFIAFFKQQLHTQADAQQRFFLCFFAQNRHKAGGLELGHSVGKRPDAGQQNVIRRPQIVGIAGHADLCAQAFDTGRQAEQVAYAVVNNSNHMKFPPLKRATP